MVASNNALDERPLHDYERIGQEDYADLKFDTEVSQPKFPLAGVGKNTADIVANNAVSTMRGISELASVLSLSPSHYFLSQKAAVPDLDPNYDDAIEKFTSAVKENPHAFISAAVEGLADEWDNFTSDPGGYAAETAIGFANNLTTSMKRLFTESIYDCAKQNDIDILNATAEEAEFCRGQAIMDALVVSDVYPGSLALKAVATTGPKLTYNAYKQAKKEVDIFLHNNTSGGGPEPQLASIGSTFSGVNNNGSNSQSWKKDWNVNNIFLPVIGDVGPPLRPKNLHLNKLPIFGWGGRQNYNTSEKELERIYKNIITPALEGKEHLITHDIMNDLKLLEPEVALQVTRQMAHNWKKYGWMPGKNNALFTEINDKNARVNYGYLPDTSFDSQDINEKISLYQKAADDAEVKGAASNSEPYMLLEQLMNHEELFKILPEFRNIKVKFIGKGSEDGKSKAVAFYRKDASSSDIGEIHINMHKVVATDHDREILSEAHNNNEYASRPFTDATLTKLISDILHETQHTVQDKVNFLGVGRHKETQNAFNKTRLRNVERIQNIIERFKEDARLPEADRRIRVDNTGQHIIGNETFPDGQIGVPLPSKFYLQFYPDGQFDIITDRSKVGPTYAPQIEGTKIPLREITMESAELVAKKLEYDIKNRLGTDKGELFNRWVLSDEGTGFINNPVETLLKMAEDGNDLDIKDYLTYWSDYAEVDARLVEDRINLTPELRRDMPPWLSGELIKEGTDTFPEGLPEGKFGYFDSDNLGTYDSAGKSSFATVPSNKLNRISIFEILSEEDKNFEKLLLQQKQIKGIVPLKFEENIKSLTNFRTRLEGELKNSDLYKQIWEHVKVKTDSKWNAHMTMKEKTAEITNTVNDMMSDLADEIMFADMSPDLLSGILRVGPSYLDNKGTFESPSNLAGSYSKSFNPSSFIDKLPDLEELFIDPLHKTVDGSSIPIITDPSWGKNITAINPDFLSDNLDVEILNPDFLTHKFHKMGIGNISNLIEEVQTYYLAKTAEKHNRGNPVSIRFKKSDGTLRPYADYSKEELKIFYKMLKGDETTKDKPISMAEVGSSSYDAQKGLVTSGPGIKQINKKDSYKWGVQ